MNTRVQSLQDGRSDVATLYPDRVRELETRLRRLGDGDVSRHPGQEMAEAGLGRPTREALASIPAATIVIAAAKRIARAVAPLPRAPPARAAPSRPSGWTTVESLLRISSSSGFT